MDTTNFTWAIHIVRKELVNHIFVTAHTVTLQHAAVLGLNLYGLMKVLQRETLGMVIAVFGFGQVFCKEGVRQMAIYAPGHSVMARLLPRFVLGSHNMAIHAGRRIGAEVG